MEYRVWLLEYGVRHRGMENGVWNMGYYTEHGTLNLKHGIWNTDYGVWSVTYGGLRVEYGFWSMEYGL